MVTYVLDSSAVLRYLDEEAGAARVAEIIQSHLDGLCEVVIAAAHWGEIAGVTAKLRGRQAMDFTLECLRAFGFVIVEADEHRAVRAALIGLNRKIPYADAFGVELAAEGGDRILVTADYDFKPASRDVKIEFLPTK